MHDKVPQSVSIIKKRTYDNWSACKLHHACITSRVLKQNKKKISKIEFKTRVFITIVP